MSAIQTNKPESGSGADAAATGRQWPFAIDFDMLTGLADALPSSKRTLSQLRGVFLDAEAHETALQAGDPLVYEFYELDIPERPGDLKFGTSIIYPGRVGREFHMTRGHFHQILETAEVYHVLQGSGLMMMETPEGETMAAELATGRALYVPPRWAHRTVNTGAVPLIVFYVFRSDAGHDYGTIEQRGFRQLALAGPDGQPEIVPNPRWRQEGRA